MIKSKIIFHLSKLVEDDEYQFHSKTAKKLIELGYVEEEENIDRGFHWLSYSLTDKGIDILKKADENL